MNQKSPETQNPWLISFISYRAMSITTVIPLNSLGVFPTPTSSVSKIIIFFQWFSLSFSCFSSFHSFFCFLIQLFLSKFSVFQYAHKKCDYCCSSTGFPYTSSTDDSSVLVLSFFSSSRFCACLSSSSGVKVLN